jgi:hypothetical protein
MPKRVQADRGVTSFPSHSRGAPLGGTPRSGCHTSSCCAGLQLLSEHGQTGVTRCPSGHTVQAPPTPRYAWPLLARHGHSAGPHPASLRSNRKLQAGPGVVSPSVGAPSIQARPGTAAQACSARIRVPQGRSPCVSRESVVASAQRHAVANSSAARGLSVGCAARHVERRCVRGPARASLPSRPETARCRRTAGTW